MYKDKQEWLEHRGLGGTSAGVILGHSTYQSILELYKAIVMPSGKKISYQTTSQTFGIKSEPIIRRTFAVNFPQYKVRNPRGYEMYRRKDKPYLTATLDGLLVEKDTNRKGILEIKTCDIRKKSDLDEWANQIPQKYFDQIIHYLVVMNDCEFVRLVAQLKHYDWNAPEENKIAKLETRFYYIERSEVIKSIKNLEIVETHFWEYNVLGRNIPNVKISF